MLACKTIKLWSDYVCSIGGPLEAWLNPLDSESFGCPLWHYRISWPDGLKGFIGEAKGTSARPKVLCFALKGGISPRATQNLENRCRRGRGRNNGIGGAGGGYKGCGPSRAPRRPFNEGVPHHHAVAGGTEAGAMDKFRSIMPSRAARAALQRISAAPS